LNTSSPDEASILTRFESVPLTEKVKVSLSASVALTVPIAVVFSLTE
jgi:hypothetical protein